MLKIPNSLSSVTASGMLSEKLNGLTPCRIRVGPTLNLILTLIPRVKFLYLGHGLRSKLSL